MNDQRNVIFTQRKEAMNSDQIFKYSDDFLIEIIDELISLKMKKDINPKDNSFDNKLKLVLGKNFEKSEFDELVTINKEELKKKIFDKFNYNRDERIKILGENQSKEIEKRIFLQSIDLNWKSHIQYLEQLRQVIGLRSYGQRDPLIEYKKEAFSIFENLLEKLKLDYITVLMNLKIIDQSKEESSTSNKNLIDNPKCLLILKKSKNFKK